MSPPASNRQPWYSSLEWMDVYNGIFGSSNDPQKRDAASARISIWESRSDRVPVAVSLTGLFLKALKADQERSWSTVELQMLYGAAIVRFVNSYVDLEQNKVYAQSIARIGRDLGIPSEVVDCRHSITHRDMPSLELLRHNAGICFDYLQITYWSPQAEIVKARQSSVSQSKYLASGLVALLQDLESLAPPEDLECFLGRLIEEVSSVSSNERPASVRSVLCAAADVAGLKHKDTARVLKRMGMPEYFGQTDFVSASSWCDRMRKCLPKCMEFLETILYQCPHENVTLSFLKDLVLIAYDSEINPPAVLAVFWILGQASPNLACRLVSRIINSLLSSSSPMPLQPTVYLPMTSTGSSDYKCFSSASSSSADGASSIYSSGHDGVGGYCYDYESFSLWLRAMDMPLEGENLAEDLNDTFKYQSRLVNWLRTLLLLPSPLHSYHHHASNSISPSSPPPPQIPFCLELLLHLFCDPCPNSSTSLPSPSSTSSKLGVSIASSSYQPSSSSLASTPRDVFCQRLLQCVNLGHSRVMAACRANIDSIARVAFQVLFVDAFSSSSNSVLPSASCWSAETRADKHRGLKLLLRLFEESDVRVPHSASSRLIAWISNRLLRKTTTMDGCLDNNSCASTSTTTTLTGRPQRQAFQRLLLPLGGRSRGMDGMWSQSLTQQFYAVLINLLSNGPMSESKDKNKSPDSVSTLDNENPTNDLELFPASQAASVHSQLAEIRRNALDTVESSAVQELSTLEVPYTHPGTFLLPHSQLPIDVQNATMFEKSKSIIELLPLNGSSLLSPVTEVLRSFTSDVVEDSSMQSRLRPGLKRRIRRSGDDQIDESDSQDACRPSKRLRTSIAQIPTTAATDRFMYDHNGSCMRDDDDVVPSIIQFTPLPIQQLESEIIRRQQESLSTSASSSSSDPKADQEQSDCARLIQDWTSLQDMLCNLRTPTDHQQANGQ